MNIPRRNSLPNASYVMGFIRKLTIFQLCILGILFYGKSSKCLEIKPHKLLNSKSISKFSSESYNIKSNLGAGMRS